MGHMLSGRSSSLRLQGYSLCLRALRREGQAKEVSKLSQADLSLTMRLLRGLCDAVVIIDEHHAIVNEAPRLSSMLIHDRSLQGACFIDMVSSSEEQETMRAALEADWKRTTDQSMAHPVHAGQHGHPCER